MNALTVTHNVRSPVLPYASHPIASIFRNMRATCNLQGNIGFSLCSPRR